MCLFLRQQEQTQSCLCIYCCQNIIIFLTITSLSVPFVHTIHEWKNADDSCAKNQLRRQRLKNYCLYWNMVWSIFIRITNFFFLGEKKTKRFTTSWCNLRKAIKTWRGWSFIRKQSCFVDKSRTDNTLNWIRHTHTRRAKGGNHSSSTSLLLWWKMKKIDVLLSLDYRNSYNLLYLLGEYWTCMMGCLSHCGRIAQ